MELFIAALGSLFSIVDPLGVIPVYLALTHDRSAAQRHRIVLVTMFYFALILLGFYWAGTYILAFFGISLDAMRLAGGMIIISTGLTLLRGGGAPRRKTEGSAMVEEADRGHDITFSPLAMPLLAGPGAISLLIGMSTEFPGPEDRLIITGVILALGLITYLILRLAPLLFRFLGRSGITAITKIMGFITMAVGIQFMITALTNVLGGILR
jgi:multiple antibiotic resistance protein